MSKFLCFNLMFSSSNSILCFSESLLSINLLQVVQLSNPGSSMFLIGSDTKFTAAESELDYSEDCSEENDYEPMDIDNYYSDQEYWFEGDD